MPPMLLSTGIYQLAAAVLRGQCGQRLEAATADYSRQRDRGQSRAARRGRPPSSGLRFPRIESGADLEFIASAARWCNAETYARANQLDHDTIW
jgi:hypothetical protein